MKIKEIKGYELETFNTGFFLTITDEPTIQEYFSVSADMLDELKATEEPVLVIWLHTEEIDRNAEIIGAGYTLGSYDDIQNIPETEDNLDGVLDFLKEII